MTMSKRACHWLLMYRELLVHQGLLVCLGLLACLATGTSWAASDPLVGTWQLNLSKSKITDRMKVEAVGPNKYAFTFGSGEAETIVTDGTDQPGNGGTLLSVTIEKPDSWKVVRKRSGNTLLTAIWKLSADGQTLTDTFTSMRPDGSSSTMDLTYKRTAPGSGFPAVWESTSVQMTSPFELQIQPYQDDGLTLTYPMQQRTQHLKFDGKDYPDAGPNMTGSAASGRRTSKRTLELTSKMNGKVTGTQEITVAPDLKSLTITARPAGGGPPTILAFDRK